MKTEIATARRHGGKGVDLSVQHSRGRQKITVRRGKFASRLGRKFGFIAESVLLIRWPDGQRTIAINHAPDCSGNVCSVVARHSTARLKRSLAVTAWLHRRIPCDLDGYTYTTIAGWLSARVDTQKENESERHEWASEMASESRKAIAKINEWQKR